MGQYQQWLHYRDIDRLLRTQLEELTEELAQLQNREHLLQHVLQSSHATEQANGAYETPLLQSSNEILRALTTNSNGHVNHIHHANHVNQMNYTEFVPPASILPETVPQEVRETPFAQFSQQDEPTAAISQALFAQSNLPPVEEQFTPDSVTAANGFQSLPRMFNRNPSLPPIPHTPHSESTMLPEDMSAFIDEHTRTEPRLELPWWLRNAALLNANGPIDPESIRTNRLIQRWIERWGRHPDLQEGSGEKDEQRANKDVEEGTA